MLFDYLWIQATPEYSEYWRRTNEARAAAFYPPWKAAGRLFAIPFRELAQAARRARRARETRRELHALSDRQLKDIGLRRSDIGNVAEAVATDPSDVALARADLRQGQGDGAAGREARVAPLPRPDRRRRQRPVTRAPKRFRPSADADKDRAAS